jgi:hypothetical protein
VFQQLAKEFPEKYSEAFLDNLQTVWTALHMKWGAGEANKFLKRPSSRSDYTMAKLDPGLLLTPPPGKEAGWVPITLELKYRDNNSHATKTSIGDAKKGKWWRPSKNPFWIDERRVDYTGGFTPATSNYDKPQWVDDDIMGKVDFQRDDDRMLDDDYRDWTFTPSSAPTTSMAPTASMAPTEAPSATPTAEAESTSETPKRTAFPTQTPTPEATNPDKPAFVAADFAYILSASVVDLNTAMVTSSPTEVPTSYPTFTGYEMVARKVDVTVMIVVLSFTLSVAEAQHPVMQASLKAGLADALGFAVGSVDITHVDGVAVTRGRRRLAGELGITFAIQSASTTAVQRQALMDNIVTAATEGSIVAHAQKNAFDNGVLVESLRSMDRVISLTLSDVSQASKSITVYESKRPGETNESVIVPDSSLLSMFKENMPIIIGAGGGLVLLLLICCCRRCRRCRRKSPAKARNKEVKPGEIIDENGEIVVIEEEGFEFGEDADEHQRVQSGSSMREVKSGKDMRAEPGKILV